MHVIHKDYLIDDTSQEQRSLVWARGSVSDPKLTCAVNQMLHAHCKMNFIKLNPMHNLQVMSQV